MMTATKLGMKVVLLFSVNILAICGCDGADLAGEADEDVELAEGKEDSLFGSYCNAKAKRVHNGPVRIVTASPDRTKVAFVAGCKNDVGSSLRLFDLSTCSVRTLAFAAFSCVPTPVPAVPGAEGVRIGYGPEGAVFSPDGTRLAYASPSLGLRVFSSLSRTTVKVAPAAGLFTFSPNGAALLYTGPKPGAAPDPTQASLLLWDAVSGKTKVVGAAGMVFGASQDGSRLLLLSNLAPPALVGDVGLFDFALSKLIPIASGANPVALSENGGAVLLVTDLVIDLENPSAATGKLARFATSTGKLTPIEALSGVVSAALSPDGQSVAYLTGYDPLQPGAGTLKLWQASAGASVVIDPLATPIRSGGVVALPGVFSPDSTRLAYGRSTTPTPGLAPTADLRVYRLATKKVVAVDSGVDTSFIRFSPKGSRLVYSKAAQFPFPVAELRLFDVVTGVGSLVESSTNPSLARVSQDDQRLFYLGGYYQPFGNIAADLDIRELSTGSTTKVASGVYLYALDPAEKTIYFQRRHKVADLADPDVDLYRYDLGAKAPILIDDKGSPPSDVTASALGVVYAKADGLHAAAAK